MDNVHNEINRLYGVTKVSLHKDEKIKKNIQKANMVDNG